MAIKQKIYKTTFKLRRGQSTEWSSINPLLADGEPGFELDTFKLKIGNGSDKWNALPYVASPNGSIVTDESVIFVVSSDLPENGLENKLYVVTDTKEIKIWVAGEYFLLNPESSVDLSNYVTNEQLNEKLNNYVTADTYNNFVEAVDIKYGTLEDNYNTLNETLNNVKNDLQENYVTNETYQILEGNVNNIINDVETINNSITEVNNTISSLPDTYATKEVETKLQHVETRLQGVEETYVKNDDITNIVKNEITEQMGSIDYGEIDENTEVDGNGEVVL